jgi:hypothetical protein
VYTQYEWFFPAGDVSEYSVYIDENALKTGNGSKRVVSIEEELFKIEGEKMERMRSTVINLMPRLAYAHPKATDLGFQDAMDVALEALGAKRLKATHSAFFLNLYHIRMKVITIVLLLRFRVFFFFSQKY